MLTRLFQTDPDNPRTATTSRFNNEGIKAYCNTRYKNERVFKLTGKRNKDGSYDVIGHCSGFRSNYKTELRYSISLNDMLEELKAFEDEGMAGDSVPYEADRPVYLKRNYIDKRGSNHVYTIIDQRAANDIEQAARTTGSRKPDSGTAMRLAKLRRNPKG